MNFANEVEEWERETTEKKIKLTELKSRKEIIGVLDRIVFSSPKSGYCVLKIDHKNPAMLITAVGYMSSPQEGSEYKFKGSWKEHPKYGEQFQIEEFELLLPTNKTGITKYLENTIFGVGPVKARLIVDELGVNALDQIKADPGILEQFNFISEYQINQVRDDLTHNSAQADFIASICRRGVTPRLASRIWVTYLTRKIAPDEIQKKIEENPYILIDDIDRIGFLTADKIARTVRIDKNSSFRIQAAIKHILKEATNEGHVYLPFAAIAKRTKKLLDIIIEDMTIAVMVKKMADDMELLNREENDVYLKELHKAENQLADQLKMLLEAEDDLKASDNIINYEQKVQEIEYAPEQIEALKKAIENKVSIITGGPGTGKTTVIRSICNIYHRNLPENEIYLASPTGKAAKRMEESTGREAMTIHRLLRYNPNIEAFTFGYDDPLPGPGLLIVDEFSMCDLLLARDLFAAVEQDLKVVLVGDVDQLPSVGPGSVLRDMINSDTIPVTRLKYNYRQANGSVVARMANEMTEGIVPELKDDGDFKYTKVLADDIAEQETLSLIKQLVANGKTVMDFQILSPMRKGKSGVNNLNEKIRDIVNPKNDKKPELGSYRLSDKVMVIQNDYQKGVFNGNIGKVVAIEKNNLFVDILDNDDPEPVIFKAEELDLLQLAYATTIHKSQGSEFPIVIMALTKSHFIMLKRNLLYTGMTRAKDKLILVTDPWAVRKAVKDNKVEKRYSKLAEKLKRGV
ncbi:MAG: ATP-dependent RecD-like DNA helicase [Halanaerobiales bacterium]|nr:ATP-dependent RecD-like DNA helicase [Halanaerobiales bacterium]